MKKENEVCSHCGNIKDWAYYKAASLREENERKEMFTQILKSAVSKLDDYHAKTS